MTRGSSRLPLMEPIWAETPQRQASKRMSWAATNRKVLGSNSAAMAMMRRKRNSRKGRKRLRARGRSLGKRSRAGGDEREDDGLRAGDERSATKEKKKRGAGGEEGNLKGGEGGFMIYDL